MANETKVGGIEFDVKINADDAQKELKDTSKEMDNLSKKADGADKSANKLAEGLKKAFTGAAIAKAVIEFGKQVGNAIETIETGRERIAVGTGATGEALQSMLTSAETVFKESERGFDDISDGIAEVNTRFGLMGQSLEKTTSLLTKFSDFAGGTVKENVAGISKTMQRWQIDTADMGSLLDKLTRASQMSGICVKELEESLISNAGTLQAMGYDLDESIGMLASFEKAGMSSQSVVMAMKKSFEDSAQAGTDARSDWEKLCDSIQNATDITKANAIAVKTFGNRVGTEMVTALRKGSMSSKDFTKEIKNSAGALLATDKASEKTSDSIAHLKNEIQLALGHAGQELAPVLVEMFGSLQEMAPDIEKMLKDIFGIISDDILPIITELLLPTLQNLMPLITSITGAVSSLAGVVGQVLVPVCQLLNATLKPIFDGLEWVFGKTGGFFKEVIWQTKDLFGLNEKVKVSYDDIAKTIENMPKPPTYEMLVGGDETALMLEKLGDVIINTQTDVVEFFETIEKYNKIIAEMGDVGLSQLYGTADDIYNVLRENSNNMANAVKKYNENIRKDNKKTAQSALSDFDLIKSAFQNFSDEDLTKFKSSLNTSQSQIFKWGQDFKAVLVELGETAQKYLAEQMTGALSNVGQMLSTGGADWEQYKIDAISSLSEILKQLATELALLGVKALIQGNWVGAALAGAGAIAAGVAGGAIGGIAQKLQAEAEAKDENAEISSLSAEENLTERIAQLREKIAMIDRGEDYLSPEERELQEVQKEYDKKVEEYEKLREQNAELQNELDRQKNAEAEARRIEAEKNLYSQLYGWQMSDLLASFENQQYTFSGYIANENNNQMNVVLEVDGDKLAEKTLSHIDTAYQYV